MDTSYRFTSNTEPSEIQLEELMQAVLQDVKERARQAEEKFKTLHTMQIKKALEDWQVKQSKNA